MNVADTAGPGPDPLSLDPLGLVRALRTLPAVAALPAEAFDALHQDCLEKLTRRLAIRLTSDLNAGQLEEYSAAATYQHTHPGTGEHTRAWIGANLPNDRAAVQEEVNVIVQETSRTLTTPNHPGHGNA